jgi:D-alanyl-D-alanine dipeptidase
MKWSSRKTRICLVVLLLVAAASSPWPGVLNAGSELPPGFVDLKDVVPSIVLDMRYYGPHNFLGTRVDGYEASRCILTRKAADAVARVQGELATFGLSLKVYDCFRPQRAVDHFVRWARDVEDIRTKKEFYPTVDKINLFKDGYIAEKSGHSRGSTIDLTIVPVPTPEQEKYRPHEDLRECFLAAGSRFGDNSVDMGTGFDCFHELAHTENRWVGFGQRSSRLLLKTLMEKQGFKNYEKEWWHYTLQDEPFRDSYFDFVVR